MLPESQLHLGLSLAGHDDLLGVVVNLLSRRVAGRGCLTVFCDKLFDEQVLAGVGLAEDENIDIFLLALLLLAFVQRAYMNSVSSWLFG